MDAVFKALADPSRRRMLDRLHDNNGQTLGELCEHVDMTRQGAAKHLALLEEANLVVAIRRGREKLHYLNPVPIGEIADRWIDKFERRRLRALHDLKQQLERDHAEAAIRLRDLHQHHSGKALERAARR
jgi:DNA-binding transcriptional ArsR family regulator